MKGRTLFMRNLEKEKLGMFDIIICGFNSLQHLKNDEDIDNFLKSCDNVLRNKGLLIIDIFNPDMRFLNIKEIKEYRYLEIRIFVIIFLFACSSKESMKIKKSFDFD